MLKDQKHLENVIEMFCSFRVEVFVLLMFRMQLFIFKRKYLTFSLFFFNWTITKRLWVCI